MIKTLLFCLSIFSSSTNLFAENILGDRVLLEIENSYYTQRHMEIYLLLKESLKKKIGNRNIEIVSEKNWEKALIVFGTDMLIYQETKRLGSFTPTGASVHQLLERHKKNIINDSVFKNSAKKLEISEKEILSNLSLILQIIMFQKSKERSISSLRGEDSKSSKKWLTDLRGRVAVRWFEGSQQFMKISPVDNK